MIKNINYNKLFNIWLTSLIFLVCLIIIVGGLTRLTNSGLSITEWELFVGLLPPTDIDSWVKYFNSYKQIPQYTLLNYNMSLEEFKFIFLWEYAHRLIARFIGVLFLIPFLFFIFINFLKKEMIIKLLYVFILILLQGTIGWYMVKSGLTTNTTVSHYRLSMHLFFAFSILTSLTWILLNSINTTNKKFFQVNTRNIILKLLLVMLFVQIISGAFVSGLDAGKIYQTWPLMNKNYFPDDIVAFNLFNFNQPSYVQFIHRNIAYLIFFISIYLGFNFFKKKESKLFRLFSFYFLAILTQIVLGITVLISGANMYFASMHQISSIFLIVVAINLYYRSIRY
ncbi:COX15/CtaA family protein [Pelagibacteraceae bacterium]|nr:COX15/CtaA family protein [Pelagibacteraceae bacterium]